MSDEDVIELKGSELGCLGAELGSLDKLPQKVKGAAGGITSANFSFNSLTNDTLPDLEQFSALETLILDNNDIDSLAKFPSLPHLHTLWLNKNHLKDIDEVLTVLTRTCPRLTYLSLLQNPCAPSELTGASPAEYARYRVLVKWRMPMLTYLDAAPFTAKEIETAKEKGKYYQTARPSMPPTAAATSTGNMAKPASNHKLDESSEGGDAKPEKKKDEEDLFAKAVEERETAHSGGAYYSKQQQFYSGKSSEGNRFIRDDVL